MTDDSDGDPQPNRRDPRTDTPREAIQKYLDRRRVDAKDSSLEAWNFRLKLFAEWLDEVDIGEIGDLKGYDLDGYFDYRANRASPVTLEGEMYTLKMFLQFCEDREAVPDGLAQKVRIPDLDDEERSSDKKLDHDAALALLRYYRNGDQFGTRAHVLIELLWMTGARQSAIRGLDIQDVYLDEEYVEFNHRPDTDTPLKNNSSGERTVGIPTVVADAIRTFLRDYRYDVYDEHGRAPLLASRDGRPQQNTIRTWTYLATEPCIHSPCPHDRDRASCEMTQWAHASKCPSSRAPHHIRTGSITWQRDQGLPPSVVAERVDATIETIKNHYDKGTAREKMERRRRPYLENLDIDDDATN
jgi:site-specific recombinase XerD